MRELPVCLPASVAARSSRLQGADRTSGVMQCCGRASTAPARRRARRAAQLRVVRVGRAGRDATVGFFERGLEEQSGTGEVADAMHGAERGLGV